MDGSNCRPRMTANLFRSRIGRIDQVCLTASSTLPVIVILQNNARSQPRGRARGGKMKMINSADIRADERHLLTISPVEPGSELEEFVYIVSHDLRNSARALTEVPQWIRADLEGQGVELGADMREDFDLLERHAERLDRMLLDLLTYARIGRLQEISSVSLKHLVDRVLRETPDTDLIEVHVAEDLPSVTMGYKDGFILVKCLIENVIRHCPPEGNTLWIAAGRSGDDVTMRFVDNGPGVANAHLARMFRPMTTLQRRDDVEGSGMGLAIVQRIAREYGGSVAVGNDLEKGGLVVKVTLNDAGRVPYERFDTIDFNE